MSSQSTRAEAPAPTFLTMEETMQRFKRGSANSLRKDIASGIAPAPRRIGGRNLFVESEVDDALRRMAAVAPVAVRAQAAGGKRVEA